MTFIDGARLAETLQRRPMVFVIVSLLTHVGLHGGPKMAQFLYALTSSNIISLSESGEKL